MPKKAKTNLKPDHDSQNTGFRCPRDLLERASKIAARDRCSVSYVIVRCLVAHLPELEK